MTEKEKNGRITGWKNRLKFVFERLNKGLRPADFRREEERDEVIPHATLQEYLDFLHDSGIAYPDEKNGIWYYTWKKEKEELMRQYDEYANVDEFQAKLNHSEKLIVMLKEKSYEGVESLRLSEGGHIMSLIRHSKSFDKFLQHLQTGYPDVFNLYQKWDKLEVKKSDINEVFTKEIKKIVLEKGFEIKSYSDLKKDKRQVSSIIFASIRRYCERADEPMLKEGAKLSLRDDMVFDPIMNEFIAKNVHIKEEIESLIGTFMQAKTIRDCYTELSRIEKQESDSYSDINKEIGDIIDSVELGWPLKGVCNACSGYTISRK